MSLIQVEVQVETEDELGVEFEVEVEGSQIGHFADWRSRNCSAVNDKLEKKDTFKGDTLSNWSQAFKTAQRWQKFSQS